jgi:hypothetical protein
MGEPTVLLFALLIALVVLLALGTALGVSWFMRRSQVPVSPVTGGFRAGRETATRIDSPVSAEVGAFLEVVSGDELLLGRMIPMYTGARTLAGRSVELAELVFNLHSPHSVVSRLHCEFDEVNGIYRVRDLGSTQGTFVNGMRLMPGGEGQILLEGDRVELGPAERGGVLLRFHNAKIRLVLPLARSAGYIAEQDRTG